MVLRALVTALLLTPTSGLPVSQVLPARVGPPPAAALAAGAHPTTDGADPARVASRRVVDVPQGRWQPPVAPLRVVRRIRVPARNWLPGHRGVDVRAHPGAPVRAAGPGRVAFAAVLAGRGVVVVDHGSLRTTYEPVAATVLAGDRVRAGEVIGAVAAGTGHCGDGECLHWGLRQGRTYLDPLLLLGSNHALLRPW